MKSIKKYQIEKKATGTQIPAFAGAYADIRLSKIAQKLPFAHSHVDSVPGSNKKSSGGNSVLCTSPADFL